MRAWIVAGLGLAALLATTVSCSAAEPSFDAQRKVCEDAQAGQSVA